jgi:DNA-binding transcriptional regulator LsrR (DeoR family)
VRITVTPDERVGYLHNLERNLRLNLGLDDLVLVTGRHLSATKPREICDDILTSIVREAAVYLDELLTDHDILAVGGGSNIMRQITRHLRPSQLHPDLHVVPTLGFVETHASLGDSNLISYDIATAYGAKHAWLPIPAIVETEEQCHLARSLPLARDVIQLMEEATIVIMGIWPQHHGNSLISRGILTQDQLDRLNPYEPVADINHWVFDPQGNCINYELSPPPYYLTGLQMPLLKKRVEKGEIKSILVAGASRAYIPAIKAVLNAGIVNTLITDHVTATLLGTQTQES